MLEIISLNESEKWNHIVRSFDNYDVYYLSGYPKAFQLHGDGNPLLFYYHGDGDDLRGINVVMKRDIALVPNLKGKIEGNKWFDFSTPYGYGGWLFEGWGDNLKLNSEYSEWCYENHVISEFVRFHPILENAYDNSNIYKTRVLGNSIALELKDEEGIWANLTSKNRNMIRKAEKAGINIGYGNSSKLFEEFHNIYDSTMEKVQSDHYYRFKSPFYESIRKDLSENSLVFYAEKDGVIIAASIILTGGKHLNYHLSGALSEYKNLASMNLLLYQVAKWGCKNGFTTLLLGGGISAKADSLYQFKKSFYRGEPRYFTVGTKIFNKKQYDKLLNLNVISGNSNYFPEYRG